MAEAEYVLGEAHELRDTMEQLVNASIAEKTERDRGRG